MTGEDRRDDVLLYASGAFDEAERRDVERYLAAGGPRAVGELAEAEATLSHLALSLDPLEPPERVKQALLESVKRSRPQLLRASLSAPRLRSAGATRGWVRTGLVGAAAASLVWFGVYTAMEKRVGGLERTLVQQAASLSLLTGAEAAPEIKVIELAGPALRHRGFGRMYQNWQTGECYLFAHGIRPPQPGYTYRVWFTTMEGEVVPGGRLLPDERGNASFLTRMPRNVDVGAPVLITLESDLGLHEHPSGSLQLVGEYRL